MREIGRGGMASVHLARQVDLDRLVALKELRALQDWDASLARRFLREARLAGSLSHPNIVTVHEYFEDEGIPYIAMEYLARGSLRPYVGRLNPAQVGGVMEGLLAGLGHAERRQIVHRDIKPENLLVTNEGGITIADFGIAKATNVIEQTAPMTRTGTTVGTPYYIAPEQAMARELGPWTDLYSAGVTAFELFAGRTPFADTKEPMAVVLRQINEPIPPLTAFAPHVDPRIAAWIGWLVAKDPARRPQSADAAWEALDETLLAVLGPRWRRQASLGPLAPQRPAPRAAADPRRAATVLPRRRRAEAAPAAPPTPRRRPPIVARAGLLVAVLAAVAAFVGNRQGAGEAPAALTGPSTAGVVAATPTTSPTSGLASEAAAARDQAALYRAADAQVAKRPGKSATEVQSRAALQRTAKAYDRAAAAAERGDRAGYETALAEATAGTQTSTSATVTTPPAPGTAAPKAAAPKTAAPKTAAPKTNVPRATTPMTTAPATVAPVNTVPPAATQPTSTCGGDSLSDDPSDDEC
jgi:hypothetical protein